MKKPSPSLKGNERRLAVIAAAAIGSWVVLSWGLQPLWTHAADLRLETESQTERLMKLTRLIQEAPAIEQDYSAVASYFSPQSGEQAHRAFLAELENLTRDAGLHMNLKPRTGKQETHQSRFEVELEVSGSQPQLMQFMDSLLALPRLVTIERLRIASMPSSQDTVRAQLVLQGIVPNS